MLDGQTWYEQGKTELVTYILMDHVDGVSVDEVIYEIDERMNQDIFRQAVDILSNLHKCGVYHCDIKLDNFMLTGDYRLVLVDFGLARWKGDPIPLGIGTK